MAKTTYLLKLLLNPYRVIFVPFCLTLTLLSGSTMAKDKDRVIIPIDDFSLAVQTPEGGVSGWKSLNFPTISRHTRYEVVTVQNKTVLRASSHASAGAIYKNIEFDLEKFPFLNWSWMISGVLSKGNAFSKDGDDYPARIYITFKLDPKELSYLEGLKYQTAKLLYGITSPVNAINYIWANKLKKDTFTPNPYSYRALMYAVESGSALSGKWVSEKRNVFKDYERIFKRKPPPLVYIAIMTDTDNTGQSATTYYDDIFFSSE